MLWFLVFPQLPWFLLLLVVALAYLAWVDVRRTDWRPIVQFWWILLVLLTWVPGWAAMKVAILVRARRTA